MWANKLIRWYNAIAARFKTSQIVYLFLVNPKSRKGTSYWGQSLERDTTIKETAMKQLRSIIDQHPNVMNIYKGDIDL